MIIIDKLDFSKLKEVKFSTNWNHKVYCQSFTSIRLKTDYWRKGEYYNIMLKNNFVGIAQLVAISVFRLSEITLPMALLDTGYNKEETIDIIKKMYSTKNINWDTQDLVWLIFDQIHAPKDKDITDTSKQKN